MSQLAIPRETKQLQKIALNLEPTQTILASHSKMLYEFLNNCIKFFTSYLGGNHWEGTCTILTFH